MYKKLFFSIFLIGILIMGFAGPSFAFGNYFDDYSSDNMGYGNYYSDNRGYAHYSSDNIGYDGKNIEQYYNLHKENRVYINMSADYIGVYLDPKYEGLFVEIYDYVIDQSLEVGANLTSLKEGIREICQENNWSNPDIVINTTYGEDMFIVKSKGFGSSMEPTLKTGSTLIVNKTNDIHVGDIVTADSDEYGMIVKRVSKIEGDNVYLISDNKNVTTFVKNGKTYTSEGVRTWVDISDIEGVVIDVLNNDGIIRV